MRLFAAIPFGPDARAAFGDAADRLREQSRSGSFTRRENVHLTLAFLGETDRIDEAKRAIGSVRADAFTLTFGDLGSFSRPGGQIYWIGVEENDGLTALYRNVWAELVRQGFPPEERPYRPHLTLGRRVETVPGFRKEAFSAALSRPEVAVDRISLMESTRIGGRLTYRPLLEQPLQNV